MLFEDEKDIIIDSDTDLEISEDGTVSWDDVLNKTNEDIVSVKKETEQNSETQKPDVIPDDSLIDLSDELDIITDNDEEDDLNEEELRQILASKSTQPKQKAFEAFGEGSQVQNQEVPLQNNEEEFDIDKQLSSVAFDENQSKEDDIQEEPVTRKDDLKKKTSGSSSIFLIAVLFAVLVAAACYYYFVYFTPQEASQEQLAQPANIQEELNNTTQEDIQNRTQEEQQTEQIPVLNEEEVKEADIQAKENKAEEKKELMPVVATGRVNPFMPIAKYIKTEPVETVYAYDKIDIPKPPEAYGTNTENTERLMSISVTGIMYDTQRPSAIISYDDNDYFVRIGDKLDNFKVVDIQKNSVTIALGTNTYKASVGEEFKITQYFEGNAQFLPAKQGGGRQYHSVSKEGHVSNSDIEVRKK